jgi:hypothetical protein
MRVLLVYPRFPQTFWSFDRAVALMGHRVLLPPLGLITVAALLPQAWDFRLVDCNIRAVDEEEWRWADLVILSAMLVQKKDLADQMRIVEEDAFSRMRRMLLGKVAKSALLDGDKEVQGQFTLLFGFEKSLDVCRVDDGAGLVRHIGQGARLECLKDDGQLVA